jgi:hypothetical protein
MSESIILYRVEVHTPMTRSKTVQYYSIIHYCLLDKLGPTVLQFTVRSTGYHCTCRFSFLKLYKNTLRIVSAMTVPPVPTGRARAKGE